MPHEGMVVSPLTASALQKQAETLTLNFFMTPETLFSHITKIERLLPEAMPKDRYAAIREIGRLRQANPRLAPEPNSIKALAALEDRLRKSMKSRERRKANRPQPLYDDLLPILDRKHEIVEAISRHPVVIVSGETGSGKTTQIPKFCLEAGRGIDGLIGCTQPRRIAAITVAGRIAEELGEPLGRSVGYQIRFQDRFNRENGYIKLMTDGILLAEAQTDRFLNAYDTLIIDEAHERSLNIDFILGILRNLIRKRTDLKIIVTSATIDTEKFSRAFNNAPVIEVSGRMYPVEVRYWKKPVEDEGEEEEEQTLAELAADAVDTIIGQGRNGDILVFMPTEHDIRETVDALEGRKYRHTVVLPLYARLSAADQMKVFASHSGRKIVVATNVAETSITVPGIRFVVDTGVARISSYDPRTRTTTLPISPVSKSSADQRKGRCGRVAAGVCIRLFSEEDYENRPLFTPPEILRADLSEVVLRMMALKLGDISSFPFIDPPPLRQIRDGFDTLLELGAIVPNPERKKDPSPYKLTPRGRLMAAIPLSPRLSRILIEAGHRGCLRTAAVIVSALTVNDPKDKPRDAFTKAEAAHARFNDPASDFMTLYNIWAACFGNPEAGKSGVRAGELKKFCKAHFMSFKRMREWQDVHEQILNILEETPVPAESVARAMDGVGKSAPPASDDLFSEGYAAIHQSILSGLLSNIAVKKEKNLYQAARGRQVMIFPGSGQFSKAGQWIVAGEMIETSRLFARRVATISVGWLETLGGSLCKSTYSNPRWQRSREAVVADQQVSLYGLVIVSGRTVQFGPVDPEKATEIFIQSALLENDVRHPLPFMNHNRELIEGVRDMENRVRRRDFLVSEDDLAAFYRKRLSGVYDLPTLKKRIREKGSDAFLRMQPSDVLAASPDEERLSLFPDRMRMGGGDFGCDYHFEPGKDRDGVTIRVPVTAVDRVPLESADWVVPGLLSEKITELIKGLPKSYRKQLVPVSATVAVIMDEMPKFQGTLTGSLSRFVHERFGVDIPAAAWNEDALPDYLKLRISLTDSRGREVLASRDKGVLRQSVNSPPDDAQVLADARRKWERTGLVSWDFPDLPESILLTGRDGREFQVYPALEPSAEAVNLRLFTNKTQAEAAHRQGVGRLFRLYFSKDFKFLEKMLVLPSALEGAAWRFGGTKGVRGQILQRVMVNLFCRNIRTQKDFQEHARQAVNRVLPEGRGLLADVLPVLEALQQAHGLLSDLETTYARDPVMGAFAADLRQSVSRLLPEAFIAVTDVPVLRHLPRYLRAVAVRAERGRLDMEKDRKRSAAVRPFEETYQELAAGLGPAASSEKQRAVADFFWAVEEFKVSLFAQELKTPYPVSGKKLKMMVQEISRME